jgi:pimeloyl-ACP methyl ester carboxylesterase
MRGPSSSVSTRRRAHTDICTFFAADAASPTPAQQGAPALDAFEQGLRTTHTPTDNPHSVLIGHSYGSTVVGEASELPGGLRVNDVIAIGGPGMDVTNANALGVGSGCAWAARAMDDPIPFLNGMHGGDPCDPFFGANTFDWRAMVGTRRRRLRIIHSI